MYSCKGCSFNSCINNTTIITPIEKSNKELTQFNQFGGRIFVKHKIKGEENLKIFYLSEEIIGDPVVIAKRNSIVDVDFPRHGVDIHGRWPPHCPGERFSGDLRKNRNID